MPQFKIGDRVLIAHREAVGYGKVGYIVKRGSFYDWIVRPRMDSQNGEGWAALTSWLTMVEPADDPKDVRIKELEQRLSEALHSIKRQDEQLQESHAQCKTLQGKLHSIHALTRA